MSAIDTTTDAAKQATREKIAEENFARLDSVQEHLDKAICETQHAIHTEASGLDDGELLHMLLLNVADALRHARWNLAELEAGMPVRVSPSASTPGGPNTASEQDNDTRNQAKGGE